MPMVLVLSVAGRVYISYVGELYPFKTAMQLANTAIEAPRLSRRPHRRPGRHLPLGMGS